MAMSPDLQEWIGIVLASAPSGYRQQLEPLLQAIELTVVQQNKDSDELKLTVSSLEAELRLLREENALLKHRLFGQSSESSSTDKVPFGPENLPIDEVRLGTEEQMHSLENLTDTQFKKPRGMRGKQRSPLPEHLPVEDVVMDLASKICPCGDTLRSFGKPEVIKRLCVRKAVCYVRQEIYLKYKCKCCGQFCQEKTPRRLLENSRYDSSFWVDIVVSKFVDFLPLDRQEKRLRRSGVIIPRSTLARGLIRIAELLSPLNDALKRFTLGGETLDVDETRVPMLMPGKGKTHTSWAWAYCRDDRRWKPGSPATVIFDFQLSRQGAHALHFLKHYTGTIMVDGFPGYDKLVAIDRPEGQIQRAFCNAHARRYFVEANKVAPSEVARTVIGIYKEIYHRENLMSNQPPQIRRELRQQELRPLFSDLYAYLKEIVARVETGTKLHKAIAYYLRHRIGLTHFLEDGRVEIDNNMVENMIRPIALLRKNAMFAGSEVGGRAWAFFASLVGTCNLNGVDPSAYFSWLFEKVEQGFPVARYSELLPWHCPTGRFEIE
jgi:transposase